MVARARPRLHVAGKALDVGAAGLEQAQVVLVAPRRILAQIQRVRLAGQAGIGGQETSQGQLFLASEHRFGDGDYGGREGCGGGHGHLPGRAGTPEARPAKTPATMIHPTVGPPR